MQTSSKEASVILLFFLYLSSCPRKHSLFLLNGFLFFSNFSVLKTSRMKTRQPQQNNDPALFCLLASMLLLYFHNGCCNQANNQTISPSVYRCTDCLGEIIHLSIFRKNEEVLNFTGSEPRSIFLSRKPKSLKYLRSGINQSL